MTPWWLTLAGLVALRMRQQHLLMAEQIFSRVEQGRTMQHSAHTLMIVAAFAAKYRAKLASRAARPPPRTPPLSHCPALPPTVAPS